MPPGYLNLALTTFAWNVSNAGPFDTNVPPGPQCQTSVTRPLTSTWTAWTVTLTVTREDDLQASTSQTVQFRDLLIASVGDSAASGEGDPDVTCIGSPTSPGTCAVAADSGIGPSNPGWANDTDAPECDRSGWAASAQAAFQIQNDDPKTSVTFWHLACSGAPINGGLIAPIPGTNATLYQGEHKNLTNTPLQAQIPELQALETAAGRKVDALLIAAGADDVQWTATVQACYIQDAMLSAGGLLAPLASAADALLNDANISPCIALNKYSLSTNLKNLPGIVDQLAATLQQDNIVAPNHVFLTEYWDPTVDNRGGLYDSGFFGAAPGFSWYCQRDPIAPLPSDRAWGHYNIVVPMNTILEQAAAREGWQWVGGIASAFTGGDPAQPNYSPSGHGVCASPGNNWVNSLWDSIDEEGGDIDGAWHANRTGQAVVMDQLLNSMTPILGLNMPPMPPEIVAFSVDTTDTPTQSFAPNCIDNFTDQLECLSIVPGSTVALSGLVEGIAGYVGTTTVQFTASAGHVTPTDTVQPNGYYGPFGGNFTAPLTAGTVSIAATRKTEAARLRPGPSASPCRPKCPP